MSQTRIKICGITTAEDARAAVACGADALGLVFYARSPRAVTVQQAAAVAAAVPPFVTLTALFVDEPVETIERILNEVPVGLLQFHGDEPADFCDRFRRPWIKAVRMREEVDLDAVCLEYRGARGILLDSWLEGTPGGTGRSFDWRLAVRGLPLPVVLAGGLDETNVARAVAAVRPAAVDVSGGVECAPGRKDADRMARFVAAVRAADRMQRGETYDD